MTRWEFCSIDYRYPNKWVLLSWRPDRAPVREILRRDKRLDDEDDEDAALRRAAQLGVDGWEIVNLFHRSMSVGGSSIWTLVLKRPVVG